MTRDPTPNVATKPLAETLEWIGWDRVLFATDYPHEDFDDQAQRQAVLFDNARAVYRQG
jgi:predicted TIM-barrel fold metal-dependent hydrolase